MGSVVQVFLLFLCETEYIWKTLIRSINGAIECDNNVYCSRQTKRTHER